MTDARPLLVLTGLSKAYGSNVVLNKFDLTIFDGEFFTLLGPSGCGKTTVLRMIAGLETADVGEIHLAGQEISSLPAEKRLTLPTCFIRTMFGPRPRGVAHHVQHSRGHHST